MCNFMTFMITKHISSAPFPVMLTSLASPHASHASSLKSWLVIGGCWGRVNLTAAYWVKIGGACVQS